MPVTRVVAGQFSVLDGWQYNLNPASVAELSSFHLGHNLTLMEPA